MHRTIAIIPARYASSRLPGKPLAVIGDSPMVWHVYRSASQALGEGNVFVATDNDEIWQAVTERGGRCIMVKEAVDCGTARCAAALTKISGPDPDVVINVQGDEPFIDPDEIRSLAECFEASEVEIATLARKFDPAEGFDTLFSPDRPKVVTDIRSNALYFSRSIIPYVRDVEWKQWIHTTEFLIHVGTYAFRASTLLEIAQLPPSMLEKAEKLEQLRWLQAGYKIKILLTQSTHTGVDTPADLEAARKIFANLHS